MRINSECFEKTYNLYDFYIFSHEVTMILKLLNLNSKFIIIATAHKIALKNMTWKEKM